MSTPLDMSPELPPPSIHPAIERLGEKTARQRERSQQLLESAGVAEISACHDVAKARKGLAARIHEERIKKDAAAASTPGSHPEDRGRRALSTTWWRSIVLLVLVLDGSIGAVTAQAMRVPPRWAVAIGLGVAIVLLLVAHLGGSGLRRARTCDDPRLALGPELYVTGVWLALGVAGCAAMAWVRVAYVDHAGHGGTAVTLLFLLASLASFAVTVGASYMHHDGRIDDAEAATRGREDAEDDVHVAEKEEFAAFEQRRKRELRRHAVAQKVTSRANRIRAHRGITGPDPDWLVHERLLASVGVPGSPVQASRFNPHRAWSNDGPRPGDR